VVDSAGTQLKLHEGANVAIREMLTSPRWSGRTDGGGRVKIAYASRTDCPDWAQQVRSSSVSSSI